MSSWGKEKKNIENLTHNDRCKKDFSNMAANPGMVDAGVELSLSKTSKRGQMTERRKKDFIPIPDAGEMELMRQVGLTKATFSGYLKEFLIDTGFNLDIGGVDMLDWKESGWALYIVIFYQLVFIMAFFYFIYTLTLSDMSRTYLSLDGNSSSRACKLVPLIITNVVEGDINGYWATANAFHQNGSIFALSLSGTQITNDIYTSIMQRFRDQLQSLSSRSALRDAAWNAMAWATFGFQGKDTFGI